LEERLIKMLNFKVKSTNRVISIEDIRR